MVDTADTGQSTKGRAGRSAAAYSDCDGLYSVQQVRWAALLCLGAHGRFCHPRCVAPVYASYVYVICLCICCAGVHLQGAAALGSAASYA